jgi:hypothetical protein
MKKLKKFREVASTAEGGANIRAKRTGKRKEK